MNLFIKPQEKLIEITNPLKKGSILLEEIQRARVVPPQNLKGLKAFKEEYQNI